jgi:hypothetical protein
MTRPLRLFLWLSLVFYLGPACGSAGGLPSAETCAAVLADASLPETLEEAQAARASGQSWTNAQIRTMYVCRALQIGPESALWVKSGADAQTRARRAADARPK